MCPYAYTYIRIGIFKYIIFLSLLIALLYFHSFITFPIVLPGAVTRAHRNIYVNVHKHTHLHNGYERTCTSTHALMKAHIHTYTH